MHTRSGQNIYFGLTGAGRVKLAVEIEAGFGVESGVSLVLIPSLLYLIFVYSRPSWSDF